MSIGVLDYEKQIVHEWLLIKSIDYYITGQNVQP